MHLTTPARLSVLAIAVALGMPRASSAAVPGPVKLVGSSADWDNDLEHLADIFNLAVEQLTSIIPSLTFPTLEVTHWDQGHPRILHARGANGEIQLKLSSRGGYWGKAVYQFSHEMGHILTNYSERASRNFWFEHAMCEAIALFVVSRMSESWKKQPRYPEYASEFTNYANAFLAESRFRLRPDQTMSQWLQQNLPVLVDEQNISDRTQLVATYLLPLLLEEPKHLEALRWMNLDDKDGQLEFEAYLQAWHDRVPAPHGVFVEKIQAMFGYVRVKPMPSSVPKA